MVFPEKIFDENLESIHLKLGNGWSARVILSDSAGRKFTKDGWLKCLAEPELLFGDVEKVLKKQGRNCVAVKNLKVGDELLKVVVKRHYPKLGFRQFFRSFRPGRALRNFGIAEKLRQCGIPTATSLAALQQRKAAFTKQSIYITEFYEKSCGLHHFPYNDPAKSLHHSFKIKKQLCRQTATILAQLHNNGLWHRDSKANNFMVYENANSRYKVLLVDLDGIKRYFLRRGKYQLRSLWRLGASAMSSAGINRTDYWRTFSIYCSLIGLEESKRRPTFRKLVGYARDKYLGSVQKKNS